MEILALLIVAAFGELFAALILKAAKPRAQVAGEAAVAAALAA